MPLPDYTKLLQKALNAKNGADLVKQLKGVYSPESISYIKKEDVTNIKPNQNIYENIIQIDESDDISLQDKDKYEFRNKAYENLMYYTFAKALKKANDPTYNLVLNTNEVRIQYDIDVDRIQDFIEKNKGDKNIDIEDETDTVYIAYLIKQTDAKNKLNEGVFQKLLSSEMTDDFGIGYNKEFLKSLNNPVAIAAIDIDYYEKKGHILDTITDKDIEFMDNNFYSPSEVSGFEREAQKAQELKENKEKEVAKQNTLKNIAQAKYNRDQHSWAWFIFRPISNAINYYRISKMENNCFDTYYKSKVPKHADDYKNVLAQKRTEMEDAIDREYEKIENANEVVEEPQKEEVVKPKEIDNNILREQLKEQTVQAEVTKEVSQQKEIKKDDPVMKEEIDQPILNQPK